MSFQKGVYVSGHGRSTVHRTVSTEPAVLERNAAIDASRVARKTRGELLQKARHAQRRAAMKRGARRRLARGGK